MDKLTSQLPSIATLTANNTNSHITVLTLLFSSKMQLVHRMKPGHKYNPANVTLFLSSIVLFICNVCRNKLSIKLSVIPTYFF